ncbi:MAG: nickel-dependent hydrogenase large subunit [Gammaproteobacteria bacterium]|nr:nickel-dependent hydrogenase large subunit [Gammaproteobacteria bacterium]
MGAPDAKRRVIGPFNRVEGDLEVEIEIADGRIAGAWVNSPLYRGFEQILVGKDPRDALTITPRICGICSVSQSVAAATALADVQGIDMAPNGRLATNLILACENMADHLSHFYLFFMPDFARDGYRRHAWHAATAARFAAQTGSASRDMLPARADFLHITGLLAGKWPHSLALQPGGTTRAVEPRERLRLQAIIRGFRRFLEQTLFDDTLEAVAALADGDALDAWAAAHAASDFGRFLALADALQLATLGRAGDRFLSYGAYAGDDGQRLFAAGTWDDGSAALQPQAITEDISHSWLHAQREPRHPYQGSTLPDADAPGGYSWCKAPRYAGRVFEVGALARQQVDGHALIRDLVATHGGNVRNRVVARVLELARVVPVMEQWVGRLRSGEPFCLHGELPDEGQGAGMVEAARGSLGHWLQVRNGRILNYQIVAPTTWNFSPRDAQATPGALEQALQGTQVDENGKDTLAIQHIVRSFDPCMVCTVH